MSDLSIQAEVTRELREEFAVARLLRRRDEIDQEWAELEEAGKLRYFGCNALTARAWRLSIERINILSRLLEMQKGGNAEAAEAVREWSKA